MKLIFIGSGSAFTIGAGNYHSNALLVSDASKKMLIDCGSDARFSLNEIGYSYQDIDDVYISHLHADHVGGMEWLALNNLFDPKCTKPHLHANEVVLYELWHNVLSGGLNRVKGDSTTLETFFEVDCINKEGSFTWEGSTFRLVFKIHVETETSFMPCYGLFFNVGDKYYYYTADTQFHPEKEEEYYKKADLIFHDCETSLNKSGVHPRYEDLCSLDPSIKAKMWLYHYDPKITPDAEADGFKGFVKRGQVFDL